MKNKNLKFTFVQFLVNYSLKLKIKLQMFEIKII